jgi:hypothetical protein
MNALANCLSQQVRRLNSGFLDCPTICRSVSAIYAPAREIDEHIRIFQFGCPLSQICSIPIDDAPRRWCNPASEDYDIMSLSLKISGKDVANMSAATGKNDAETGLHACRL